MRDSIKGFCRKLSGSEFQCLGPMTLKALTPAREVDLGMLNILYYIPERSDLVGVRRVRRAARYFGAPEPCSELYMRMRT